MSLTPTSDKASAREFLDVLIRAGMIAALVIFSYMIFYPFLDLMLWSIILAVSIYPLHVWLRRKTKKEWVSATIIVLVSIAVLVIPVYLMSASIAGSVGEAVTSVKDGGVSVPPPSDSVASWPLIGPKVHAIWTQASTDLSVLTVKFAPQIKAASFAVLGKVAGFAVGILLFIASLMLMGVFIAFGEHEKESAEQIASRIVGPEKGPSIVALCTSTIRAVAQGVVGIAFIQMILIGIGFVLLGVPGAGLLSLLVLLLGIMQVPATIVTIPVLILLFANRPADTMMIVFGIYLFVAGLADNVLKPIMLGRGTSVPMPVVLIGALGGMVTKGIIGLFMGPVILAIAYELFWNWVKEGQASTVGKDSANA